jgi:hypothetical protein
MPVVAIAARLAAKRKAALAATRKKIKADVKRKAESIEKVSEDAKEKISWLEIILVVVFIALPNDLLDVINLTGVGKIVTIFIEPITLIAIFFWFWFRVQQKASRGFFRGFLIFIAEIIPVVGLLPLWTLLVINVKTGWLNPILDLPTKIFKT